MAVYLRGKKSAKKLSFSISKKLSLIFGSSYLLFWSLNVHETSYSKFCDICGIENCEMNQDMVNWAQNQLKSYHWSHECKDTEFIALVSLEIVFLY